MYISVAPNIYILEEINASDQNLSCNLDRSRLDCDGRQCIICFEVPKRPVGCIHCRQMIGCEACILKWRRTTNISRLNRFDFSYFLSHAWKFSSLLCVVALIMTSVQGLHHSPEVLVQRIIGVVRFVDSSGKTLPKLLRGKNYFVEIGSHKSTHSVKSVHSALFICCIICGSFLVFHLSFSVCVLPPPSPGYVLPVLPITYATFFSLLV